MKVNVRQPLVIDLYCGLGGWTEGFLAEGYRAIGFDIKRHDYGTGGYPGQLVLQDVRTLHGSQFKDAAVIVASPPCQKYSYMAMPWSRAKQMAREIQASQLKWAELNELFVACFRIAHEAGVPLIVENVRGAQPWVGQAKWHYGSYYLWGDVPALMPMTNSLRLKGGDRNKNRAQGHAWTNSFADTIGVKAPGMNWSDQTKRGQDFTRCAAAGGYKLHGNNGPRRWEDRKVKRLGDATKNRDTDGYERNHPEAFGWKAPRTSSHSNSRKAASAQIAKIPFALARHIARSFAP